MATVAAVYTVAPHVREPEQVARGLAPIHEVEGVKRPKPEDKRVWASLERTPEEVVGQAFRHLVKDRMELTGARWSLAGAEAVLCLRALRASGDFEEYWKFHEAQEYERNHAVHYAGAQAPKTEKVRPKGQKTNLRLVK